jgi:hypothetical protein
MKPGNISYYIFKNIAWNPTSWLMVVMIFGKVRLFQRNSLKLISCFLFEWSADGTNKILRRNFKFLAYQLSYHLDRSCRKVPKSNLKDIKFYHSLIATNLWFLSTTKFYISSCRILINIISRQHGIYSTKKYRTRDIQTSHLVINLYLNSYSMIDE